MTPFELWLSGALPGIAVGAFVLPPVLRFTKLGLEGMAEWYLEKRKSPPSTGPAVRPPPERRPLLAVFYDFRIKTLKEPPGAPPDSFRDLLVGTVHPDGSITDLELFRSRSGIAWHSMKTGGCLGDGSWISTFTLAENAPRIKGEPCLWVTTDLDRKRACLVYKQHIEGRVGVPLEIQWWLDGLEEYKPTRAGGGPG